jgi:hypothetical protein
MAVFFNFAVKKMLNGPKSMLVGLEMNLYLLLEEDFEARPLASGALQVMERFWG